MAKKSKKNVAEKETETPDIEQEQEELEQVESLSREDTANAVYAMLFASDRPLSPARLAEALGDIDQDVVVNILEELTVKIGKRKSPYDLREIAGGYQLTTDPAYAPYIRRLFQLKRKNKLSKAVLETLAIIAYRQPVTRPDVESIRGVSVSHAFNQLQERHLIKAVGYAEAPGRPRIYRTTDEFLLHFGLKSLDDMPSIEELQELA